MCDNNVVCTTAQFITTTTKSDRILFCIRNTLRRVSKPASCPKTHVNTRQTTLRHTMEDGNLQIYDMLGHTSPSWSTNFSFSFILYPTQYVRAFWLKSYILNLIFLVQFIVSFLKDSHRACLTWDNSLGLSDFRRKGNGILRTGLVQSAICLPMI